MEDETRKAVMPSREFAIPIDLLKSFENNVRTHPDDHHATGWIMFDREMLISVLTSGNAAKQMELAKNIQKLGEAGGELVIMQR